MPWNRCRPLGVAVLMLSLLFVSSCATTHSRASSQAAPSPNATAREIPPADAYTCASVEGLFGHLAAQTARWSPNVAPFDRVTAKQIRQTSVSLRKQLPQAQTSAVRLAVTSSASAFDTLATAMWRKNQVGFNHALASSRTAYGHVKAACKGN